MKDTKLQRFSKVHVLKITGNLSSYVVTYRHVYCVYLNIRREMFCNSLCGKAVVAMSSCT